MRMPATKQDNGFWRFQKVMVDPLTGEKTRLRKRGFKMDFSSTRDIIENKWSASDRFFAGVPTIPNKKKDGMSIYLLFIQHILYSLKDDGKAAIVVPTGFITAQSGIEKKIRERIIDNKWLKGVISMPSNIFANTGTNVSI